MDYEDDEYPYEILSKPNKRLISTQPSVISSPKNHHSHGCCAGHHH